MIDTSSNGRKSLCRDKDNFAKKARDFKDILDRANLSEQSLCELAELTEEWEVPRNQISLGRVLGEGAFGEVHFAEALGYGPDGGSIPVAVKMLKKDSSLADKVRLFHRPSE